MGIFKGEAERLIDEDKLVDGAKAIVNELFTRLLNELLTTKRVKITIELVARTAGE